MPVSHNPSPAITAPPLQHGTLGWASVAALGVAIAISGDFSGWNFGLGLGGLGGMLTAALAMAVFSFGLTQCVAEVAAALHDEAGFDGYVRRLLGPSAGFVCGVAVAVALALASGLILSFIEAYASATLGLGGWGTKLVVMVAVLILQSRGARDAVAMTMVVGAAALLILAAYCLFVAPGFDLARWHHVAGAGGEQGWSAYFPHGFVGTLQCVPYALFMFLGVEQATQAASEMRDMTRSLPKALIVAIAVAVGTAMTVLVVSTGVAGMDQLAASDDPLLTVVSIHPERVGAGTMLHVVGFGALSALLSTFFSLVYASSRQFFHLACAGDLPAALGGTNRRGAPVAALGVVGLLGVVASAFPPEAVVVVMIFTVCFAYVHVVAAFIQLRRRAPSAQGPYRAIGGLPMSVLTGILTIGIMASCYFLQTGALSVTAIAIAALYAYARFIKYRRRFAH